MKHLIYICILVCGLGFSACNDYLDIVPKGNKIPTTLADYEALLRDEYTIGQTSISNALYLLNDYALKNMPRNDYDVIGKMTLLRNPVLPLTEREQEIFMEDVRLISRRLTEIGHRFHNDLMGCLVEAFCLDLYDFHARRYAPPQLGKQSAVILTKFLNMLKEGACEQHREVSYYASKLCITPKYLSEISKKVSGFGANAWIDRFAIVGIARLLACKDIPLKAIADRYRFSSLPYFSRYVQKQLGVPPSEYRKSLE